MDHVVGLALGILCIDQDIVVGRFEKVFAVESYNGIVIGEASGAIDVIICNIDPRSYNVQEEGTSG